MSVSLRMHRISVITSLSGDAEFAGVENAVVDLLAPDSGTLKCRGGNIGRSNVWKAKLVIGLA